MYPFRSAVDDTHVTYKVKPSGSKHTVTRRVPGETFVGGFVQHVLPPGFHKVRYYGWMNSSSRIDLDEVRWLACAAMTDLSVDGVPRWLGGVFSALGAYVPRPLS